MFVACFIKFTKCIIVIAVCVYKYTAVNFLASFTQGVMLITASQFKKLAWGNECSFWNMYNDGFGKCEVMTREMFS